MICDVDFIISSFCKVFLGILLELGIIILSLKI